jgi:hypothetical protein
VAVAAELLGCPPPQVLDGLTANGGTYIAAMDRSSAASFVMRAQSQDHKAKLLASILKLERSLGLLERWRPDSEPFKVGHIWGQG